MKLCVTVDINSSMFYSLDDKIVKVELQAQATTHDEHGNVFTSNGYKAVPRIQLPFIDHK